MSDDGEFSINSGGEGMSWRPNTTGTPQSGQYADRYIPLRPSDGFEDAFALATTPPSAAGQVNDENHRVVTDSRQSDPNNLTYNLVLRNEILGTTTSLAGTDGMWLDEKARRLTENQRVLHYNSQGAVRHGVSTGHVGSVVSTDSRQLLCAPQKTPRRIPKVPFKVLDAPDLQDDFYLNLVDWSQQNVLSVGLGSCVYLWSACTSQVTKLCDLATSSDVVTSVGWMSKSNHLAVGTNRGEVQIWDTEKSRKIRTMTGHIYRVGRFWPNSPPGVVASRSYVLASGSRDRTILIRDVRARESFTNRLSHHKQEVCGLKWSGDRGQLASGGNDNKLFVWDAANWGQGPALRFADHQAAVKAIAWSPHQYSELTCMGGTQHGLLASGGGTADKCIRFWNTITGQRVSSVDTGSQVCNLAWSKTSHELVSTHGYQENQIVIWKYPSMTQVANLTGHTYRVLYLAMSPDGQNIVTGAGDETLRFWSVFNKSQSPQESTSLLSPFTQIR